MDGTTAYEFSGDGNGALLLPNVTYEFTYKIKKDQISIDYENESVRDGTTLSIYDKERTICDCFKYRTKLDNELFAKAVKAYAADKNKNLANLIKYAKQLRVYKKVTDIMEVLLNG